MLTRSNTFLTEAGEEVSVDRNEGGMELRIGGYPMGRSTPLSRDEAWDLGSTLMKMAAMS